MNNNNNNNKSTFLGKLYIKLIIYYNVLKHTQTKSFDFLNFMDNRIYAHVFVFFSKARKARLKKNIIKLFKNSLYNCNLLEFVGDFQCYTVARNY